MIRGNEGLREGAKYGEEGVYGRGSKNGRS